MIKTCCFAFISFVLIASCKNVAKEKQAGEPVQGRYTAICLQEGITDDTKADTSLVITVDKDSISFSKQKIANCCGWFDSLSLRLASDTLRLVDDDRDMIRSACDCSCLFQEWITLDRSYFDKIGVVDFGGRLIFKHETEINE